MWNESWVWPEEGCRDERRGSSASEVRTEDGDPPPLLYPHPLHTKKSRKKEKKKKGEDEIQNKNIVIREPNGSR